MPFLVLLVLCTCGRVVFALDVHWTLPYLLGCCSSIEVFFTPCLSWCLPFDFLVYTCLSFSHIQSDNLAHLDWIPCLPW